MFIMSKKPYQAFVIILSVINHVHRCRFSDTYFSRNGTDRPTSVVRTRTVQTWSCSATSRWAGRTVWPWTLLPTGCTGAMRCWTTCNTPTWMARTWRQSTPRWSDIPFPLSRTTVSFAFVWSVSVTICTMLYPARLYITPGAQRGGPSSGVIWGLGSKSILVTPLFKGNRSIVLFKNNMRTSYDIMCS